MRKMARLVISYLHPLKGGIMTTSDAIADAQAREAIDPLHYTATRVEPIDVIEAWGLGFNLGNAVKYIARAGRKDDRRADLIKAANYAYREATGEWLPKALIEAARGKE
jgi:hypothetical protein